MSQLRVASNLFNLEHLNRHIYNVITIWCVLPDVGFFVSCWQCAFELVMRFRQPFFTEFTNSKISDRWNSWKSTNNRHSAPSSFFLYTLCMYPSFAKSKILERPTFLLTTHFLYLMMKARSVGGCNFLQIIPSTCVCVCFANAALVFNKLFNYLSISVWCVPKLVRRACCSVCGRHMSGILGGVGFIIFFNGFICPHNSACLFYNIWMNVVW